MKRILTFAAILAAVALAPGPASAESPFELNNHLSVLNIATAKVGGGTSFLAAGYHFNLIHVGRFEFLGAGLGVEAHNPPEQNNIESIKFSPAFTGQVVDVLIGDPKGDATSSFGASVAYLPNAKAYRLVVGFSIRIK